MTGLFSPAIAPTAANYFKVIGLMTGEAAL